MGTDSTLYSLIFPSDRKDQIAIQWKNQQMSYREVRQKVDRRALELKGMGLPLGALMVIRTHNHPSLIIDLLAAERMGLRFLPIPIETPLREMMQILASFHQVYFVDGNQVTFHPNSAEQNFWQTASGVVFRSSGSTGAPKPILHAFTNLATNGCLAAKAQEMGLHTVALVTLPMHHTGGLNMQTLPALIAGGQIVITDHFTPSAFFESQKHKPTHTILVPSQVRWFFRHQNKKHLLHPNLTYALTGSTPLSQSDWDTLQNHFSKTISVFGLSEMGPFVMTTEAYKKPIDGSISHIGQPISPYSATISNGQIALEGPCRGEVLGASSEGPLLTGDLGKQESQDFYYCGRTNRTLSVAGHKFSPLEVENCLLSHASVIDCAVTSNPHPLWNEVPIAYVIGQPKKKTDLLAYCRSRLSSYKVPRKVYYVQNLPRTEIGKAQYQNLKKQSYE